MRNFILSFTIVAMAMALLFTACQKNVEQETVTNGDLSALWASKISPEEWSPILLPQDFDLSDENLYQFIAGLSEEDLRTRMETYRIYNLIKQADKLPQLHEEQPNFEVLTEADLQKYAPEVLKNPTLFENKSSDFSLSGVNSLDAFTGITNGGGFNGGGCNNCNCTVLSVSCQGSTLFVAHQCCNPICVIEFIPFPNHELCTGGVEPCNCDPDEECVNNECVPVDPCAGVVCPPGYRCVDGDCILNGPCYGVVCPLGQICVNGTCEHRCDPPCPKNQHCIHGECIEL